MLKIAAKDIYELDGSDPYLYLHDLSTRVDVDPFSDIRGLTEEEARECEESIEDLFNPLGIKLYEVEEEDDGQANDR